VEGLRRVYRLDSTGSDRRQQTAVGCVGGQPGVAFARFFSPALSRCGAPLRSSSTFLERPFSREPVKPSLTKTSGLKF
jgi:hypothetical protein